MTTLTQEIGPLSQLLARVASAPEEFWVPNEFAELGNRSANDKPLPRMVASDDLHHIDCGL